MPATVRATLEADPAVLYAQMKDAYAKGDAAGWNFRSEEIYLSTIFNAGRAYSLQYPDDPAYGELATLTVRIGTGLHYNPLTNHDGAVWWVREAADWVEKHSEDRAADRPSAGPSCSASTPKTTPSSSRASPMRMRQRTSGTYPGDVDALLIRVEADWRAWLLTHDPRGASLALARAAAPNFPVAHLPTNWGNELVNAANGASTDRGYTDADVQNAQTFLARLKAVDPIRVIATVTALPHDVYLTTLAPADEYFGAMGMSILEIENRLKHINFMLDYDYGNRESDETTQVANSIVEHAEGLSARPRPADADVLVLHDAAADDRRAVPRGRSQHQGDPHHRVSGQPASAKASATVSRKRG